jgi:hypothetical protein
MWWFAEYVFLKRNWDFEVPPLKKSLEWLKDFPIPFIESICFQKFREQWNPLCDE